MNNLQKHSKLIEKHKKNTITGRFFEVYSILAEKQRLKPKNSNSLKFSASFDTHLDPRGAVLVEILQFLHFVLKFDNSGGAQWARIEKNGIFGRFFENCAILTEIQRTKP